MNGCYFKKEIMKKYSTLNIRMYLISENIHKFWLENSSTASNFYAAEEVNITEAISFTWGKKKKVFVTLEWKRVFLMPTWVSGKPHSKKNNQLREG